METQSIRSKILTNKVLAQRFETMLIVHASTLSHVDPDYMTGFNAFFSSQQQREADVEKVRVVCSRFIPMLMQINDNETHKLVVFDELWDTLRRYENALFITAANYEHSRLTWIQAMRTAECMFRVLLNS